MIDWSKQKTAEQKASETLISLQAAYTVAIQQHLDAKARERQYDGIQTAITYRGDPNLQYHAEGEALFAWRSAVWTYSTEQLSKVLAGERPQPSVEELINELPAFEWPGGPSVYDRPHWLPEMAYF